MSSSESPDEFAARIQRRSQAAKGLEHDLLTQVPMLYGSPGSTQPQGDPGVMLARLHREEMLRRNGGGVYSSSKRRSDVSLPYERTTIILVVGLLILAFVAR